MVDNNNQHLKQASSIITTLQKHGIDPLLYGSLGVSLYLGNFKQFNDVDLLVPPQWLHEEWQTLQTIMNDAGFTLKDEHEHEFQNNNGDMVAFAEETVLLRDNILPSLGEVVTLDLDDVTIRTLRPEDFKKAYLFSEQDGYRRDSRGKKDRQVIELLEAYIKEKSES